VGWHELDSSGSRQTPVARSCKYSSKHSGGYTAESWAWTAAQWHVCCCSRGAVWFISTDIG